MKSITLTVKLRTLVIYSDERFRKESRHQLGRIENARIVLEVPYTEDGFSADTWEEVVEVSPQVIFLELSKEPAISLRLLKALNQNLPQVPILAGGDCSDSKFLIEALRLGVKEIIQKPVTSEALQDAFARIQKLAGSWEQAGDPATILSFFSSKGGSGSTTIATNFAVSLSKLSKKRVLVFDLDVELGDAASFFGMKGSKFLVQEGNEQTILDPALIARSIATHSKTGIDLLSISDGFPEKSRALAAEIRPLLGMLQAEYDYIVVDASSTLNELTVSVLDSSHLIFLITKCTLPALRNTQRVLHGFERFGYSASRLRILVNRYLKGKDVSLREIEKALSFNVFWSIPNDYKTLIKSIQSGDPLTFQSESTPLAKSFYDLSAQVLGIPIKSHPRSGGGFLVRSKQKKSMPLTTLNLLKS